MTQDVNETYVLKSKHNVQDPENTWNVPGGYMSTKVVLEKTLSSQFTCLKIMQGVP